MVLLFFFHLHSVALEIFKQNLVLSPSYLKCVSGFPSLLESFALSYKGLLNLAPDSGFSLLLPLTTTLQPHRLPLTLNELHFKDLDICSFGLEYLSLSSLQGRLLTIQIC